MKAVKATAAKGILDEYDRNARLKPALLVILPASLLIAGLGTGFSAALGALLGSLSAVGFTWVLAQFARDLGKKKEKNLFTEWGGMPTTVLLRHRNTTLNPHTRSRYHAVAERLINKPLPSLEQEEADPVSADATYESVADCLREKTRDTKKFPLIFKELVNYGFRRNLWGMKPVGVSVALACVVVQLVILSKGAVRQQSIGPTNLVMALANIALLLCWLLIIKPDWVRVPAEAYAQRLLEACAVIDAPKVKNQT